jgi:1,2-phenylacetyl-CoA epoxidase catalytic subunit
MHVRTWLDRLADAGGESRRRLATALEAMGPDAGTVLAPLAGEPALVRHGLASEPALVRHGLASEPFAAIEARWRDGVDADLRRLGLSPLPPTAAPDRARTDHSDAFRALHAEFTMVRRSEVGATW